MRSARAMTEEELRDEFLAHIRGIVDYWAKTVKEGDVHDRCSGVAFSILSLMDGCSGLPPFKLVSEGHPQEDIVEHVVEERDWIKPGTTLETYMLHEHFYKERK